MRLYLNTVQTVSFSMVKKELIKTSGAFFCPLCLSDTSVCGHRAGAISFTNERLAQKRAAPALRT